jgi:glutamyl/glutaminyl-tRNA synthetase
MIASAIYTRTIGKLWGSAQSEGATDDSQEIISVDYLKRKGESIINWAASINKEIFSEK